ncbi:MAG TPA: MFS transporter [Steroidobacteraceae bacterium]
MNRPAARQPAFAALRHRGYRGFVLGNAVAMMADNTEHVISYWVLHQKFHSPALGAFAVISHWLPFLLLSGYAGALAGRSNPRRMIQCGMLLFMAVSVAWGLLFLHGQLYTWEAWILLSVHGIAGVLWTAPAQLLIHDIVGPEHLQSAVRLGTSARYLGMLAGPAIGNLLMIVLGPARGIIANALIYLPMLVWLHRPRYSENPEGGARRRQRLLAAGPSGVAQSWRSMGSNRQIIAMTVLAGCASACIGNAYQAQMPGFADDLGFGNAGAAYAALLAADAAGALVAVLVLESRSLLAATPGSALLLAACWCLAIAGFALSHNYLLTLSLLLAAGFFELSFSAMAQTIVQLQAPAAQRGGIVGLFVGASLGLRTFSGVTVGLGGALVGIHYSLALSAAALLMCVGTIGRWLNRPPPSRAFGPQRD